MSSRRKHEKHWLHRRACYILFAGTPSQTYAAHTPSPPPRPFTGAFTLLVTATSIEPL